MKTAFLILTLIVSAPVFGGGTGERLDEATLTNLESLLAVDQNHDSKSVAAFSSFLDKLGRKRTGLTEKEFVRFTFSKVHQQYLKRYNVHASFNDIFSSGSYHCLTGTALFSVILNHFEVEHTVIETNYHIFILVNTTQGEILLETTDHQQGFVDQPGLISERLNQYRQQRAQATTSGVLYAYSFSLFNEVSLQELQGLLYYNKAVESFNQNNLSASVQYLVKANEFYSSTRIDEFAQLLLLSIQHSSIESSVKENFLKQVFTIKQRVLPSVAVLSN